MTGRSDAADRMRQQVQTDLRAALKRRDMAEISVLRGLIAAIDNAGAVPLSPEDQPMQTEVERRWLDMPQVEAVVRHEHRNHEQAAREFDRLGRVSDAEHARFAMTILARYLP